MEACELLGVELRLDRIEAELARELPLHMRAFAIAHARGNPPPAAPAVLLRPSTLATARAALVHPFLADRGLALARLVAPLAIESDPAVGAARGAAVNWQALARLAAARDAAATARLGRRALDVLHGLHGTPDAVHGRSESTKGSAAQDSEAPRAAICDAAEGVEDAALPPPIAGWNEPDGVALDDRAVAAVWQHVRTRYGVDGAVRFEPSAHARPRAFVVEPGREVVVVIPATLATPAARFAVLHELGHAVAALGLSAGIPRVVDEAAAAYVARLLEQPMVLDGGWYSPLARAARSRRAMLARALARTEREIAGGERASLAPPIDAGSTHGPGPSRIERPPWALWHDPGAQAAYVAAESIADALERADPGGAQSATLAARLAAHREVIDRATVL